MKQYDELRLSLAEANKGIHYLKRRYDTDIEVVQQLCEEIDQLRAALGVAKEELEWIAGKDGGCADGQERSCAIAALARIGELTKP